MGEVLALWIFSIHINPVMTVHICNSSTGEGDRDRQVPGACQAATLARQQPPGSLRDTVSNIQCRMTEDHTGSQSPALCLSYAHMHTLG